MSQENVEIVNRSIESVRVAMERGDPGAWFDPAIHAADIEWVLTEGVQGKYVWTGREEFAEFLRTWSEQFDDWSVQVDVVDAADDRVVALVQQSGTGKETGIPVEWNSGVVYELRDGRIVRTTNYSTLAEALEAAGLSE